MKRMLVLGAVAALSWMPAWAEDASSDFDALAGDAPAAEEASQAGVFKWSGDQEFSARLVDENDLSRVVGAVEGGLSAEYSLGDWKAAAAAQVRDGEFFPGETYLQWAPGAFKVAAGLMEFSWGLADANNPTDTLNARDYRFGAEAERLVNPAVAVSWYPADWVSFDAVYEPWKQASQFPKDFQANTQAGLSSSSSALKTSLSQAAAYYTGLGQTTVAAQYTALYNLLNASYSPSATAEESEAGFDQPVYGGRANFFLPGVDLSLSYVYDRDAYYTPVVTMKKYGTLWLPESVDLVVNRIHRLGLNAKTTIDRYGLWFEGAYNITEDASGNDVAVRDNKLAWTTGLDFNWGPGSAYYVNVQYAGSWIPGYDDTYLSDYTADPTSAQLADKDYMTERTYRSLVQSLGAETEEWLHGATVSVKFPLADATVTPTFSGAVMVPVGYDDTEKTRLASAYLNPELDLAPADGIHVLFGADLAYGWVKTSGSSEVTLDTTTDKLGVYTPLNSVYLKVQYKWNGSLGNP